VTAPLATRMRPRSLAEFVGQEHVLGEGRLLRRAIESKVLGSMIFHGPPSSGKTTLALVIAAELQARFVTMNAVLDGVKELRHVVADATDNRGRLDARQTVLFVDEIHRWNKAQQDALLPHVESGLLVLIGATTENPYYSLVGPLLSRCQMFELRPFAKEDIIRLLTNAIPDADRGLGRLNLDADADALAHLAEYAAGDIRNALNALELAAKTLPVDEHGRRRLTLAVAEESIQKRAVRYDGTGDEHYHYASAFIKSLRGSDPDAALYWMAAMLEGGEDPMFLFRRMLIFASEDVGLADSFALTFVVTAQDAFERTGMPEGWYFLSHAALYLALAPKSNSTGAVFKVMAHVKESGVGSVPGHLRDKTASRLESSYSHRPDAAKEYRYPHDHPHHWVDQRHLPGSVNVRWYTAGDQGREKAMWDRLQAIRNAEAP
jgi:putative ATPase